MSKEVKEAKKKIEMLTNHLLDSIDVDLLSDSQKIAYLKAIQPFVMPRLESVRQQTSLEVSEIYGKHLCYTFYEKDNHIPVAIILFKYIWTE